MAGKHRAKPDVPSVASQRAPARRKHAVTSLPKVETATVVDRPSSAPPAPRTRPSSPPRAAVRSSKAARDEAIRSGSRDIAYQAALTPRGGRTSVAGSAGRGAVAGAATGAAVGSVVPGIGTAVGAGVGAGVGGVSGGISGARQRKDQRVARQPWRRTLVALFMVCIVIVALSPLTARKRDDPPGRFMKQATAVIGLFFVLGLISAAGPRAAKAATGLAALVALVLAVSERDLFVTIARALGPGDEQQTGPSPGGVLQVAPTADSWGSRWRG